MRSLFPAVLAIALSFGSGANALTYLVDRSVGLGSVTGFIETNGALGNLFASDIVDWALSISAPDITPSPTNISFANGDVVDSTGPAFIATTTALLFDFALVGSLTGTYTVFRQSGSTPNNYWCLDNGNCSNPINTAPSEDIGPTIALQDGQSVRRSGPVVIATLAPVPLPAAMPLLLAGLAALGLVARRRRPMG